MKRGSRPGHERRTTTAHPTADADRLHIDLAIEDKSHRGTGCPHVAPECPEQIYRLGVDISSIERYLSQPYKIYGRVSTTVSYGFASAVATREPFDAGRVRSAMVELGQDPSDLHCVFCGAPAASWDHLTGMVKNGEFSGFGHVLGSLVPACARCNSLKGNRPWRTFVDTQVRPDRREAVARLLETHERQHLGQVPDLNVLAPEETAEYAAIKSEIFELMRRADAVAGVVRTRYWISTQRAASLRGTQAAAEQAARAQARRERTELFVKGRAGWIQAPRLLRQRSPQLEG